MKLNWVSLGCLNASLELVRANIRYVGKRKLLWQFTVVIKCDPVDPLLFPTVKHIRKCLNLFELDP